MEGVCDKIVYSEIKTRSHKEGFKMNKERFKRGLYIALIIFAGLAFAITYFFLIYSTEKITSGISNVITVLRPFIIGAVIAYIMKSTCNFYEKHFITWLSKSGKQTEKRIKKRANIIAVLLTYITWIIVVGGLLWIAIPQIWESVSKFIQDLIVNLPQYINTITAFLVEFKDNHPEIAPYVQQVIDFASNWLANEFAPKLPQIGNDLFFGVVDTINVIKDFIIALVISVFMLSGRKVFAKKSALFLQTIFKEKHANAIISEFRFADRMFSGFLEGKIIDSVIIGIIYYIAITLMGIPYAALLAVICGVTNIIPFFGPFIGAIPSAFIILMSADHPIKVLYFIIFVCVIQFIDGNIIDPHIVGGNIKISPFCVIFAVLVFGGLWGFGGLLIGVPTFAVIYDIVKKSVYSKLKKTDRFDLVDKYLGEFKHEKKHSHAKAATPAKAISDIKTDAPTSNAEDQPGDNAHADDNQSDTNAN
jgi:predicted PurR-regulated permease PerM